MVPRLGVLAVTTLAQAGCVTLLGDFSVNPEAGVDGGLSDGGSGNSVETGAVNVDSSIGQPDGAHSVEDALADAGYVADVHPDDGHADVDLAAEVSTADAGATSSSDGSSPASCEAGSCNGTCLDFSSNDANCGACRYACLHGRHCVASRCTPAWLPMTATNAPTPRSVPGVTIGGRFVIAGGSINCIGSLATAAAYDPDADAWTPVPDLNAARSQHTVTSSGTYVYAFGGLPDCSTGSPQVGSLEQWKPGDTSWTVVTGSSAPTGRYAHESAWTGTQLFIFGGASGALSYVSSGAVYDPTLNAWSDASCSLVGCLRNDSLTLIDQGYVRLWGGHGGNAPASLQYQISTGAWSTWSQPNNFPTATGHSADDGRRIYVLAGGGATNLDVVIYDRRTQAQTTDPATSPANMSALSAVSWVGAELVAWSGPAGTMPTAAGGRYQPPAPQ